MALEQWEIDLRNQLKDSFLQEDKEEEKKDNSSSNKDDLWFYSSLFLFLFLSTLILIDAQFNIMNFSSKSSNKKINQIRKIDQKQEPEQEPDQKKYSADELQSIKNILKVHEKRIFLLGITNNENATILRNNKNKKEIITLNRDWTLSHDPTNIELTQSDIEYLNKIKQNTH